MTRWYVDSSAALKLILRETESSALTHLIDGAGPELVACILLETEMRRAVHRNPEISQQDVTDLLDEIDLFELPLVAFRSAGLLPEPRLRSLDALHLAAAIQLGVDSVVTYDRRMADSARSLGFSVLAPA